MCLLGRAEGCWSNRNLGYAIVQIRSCKCCRLQGKSECIYITPLPAVCLCREPPRRMRPTSSRWPRSCATPTCEQTTACTARHSRHLAGTPRRGTTQLEACRSARPSPNSCQPGAATREQLPTWQLCLPPLQPARPPDLPAGQRARRIGRGPAPPFLLFHFAPLHPLSFLNTWSFTRVTSCRHKPNQ